MPWISPDAPDRPTINIINLQINHSTNEERSRKRRVTKNKYVSLFKLKMQCYFEVYTLGANIKNTKNAMSEIPW